MVWDRVRRNERSVIRITYSQTGRHQQRRIIAVTRPKNRRARGVTSTVAWTRTCAMCQVVRTIKTPKRCWQLAAACTGCTCCRSGGICPLALRSNWSVGRRECTKASRCGSGELPTDRRTMCSKWAPTATKRSSCSGCWTARTSEERPRPPTNSCTLISRRPRDGRNYRSSSTTTTWPWAPLPADEYSVGPWRPTTAAATSRSLGCQP